MSFFNNFTTGANIVFDKMKTKTFWSSFLKVAFPFFIIVTLVSLLIGSWKEIFAGDFTTVSQIHFTEGKWKTFFGMKLFVSFFYGLYISIRNIK